MLQINIGLIFSAVRKFTRSSRWGDAISIQSDTEFLEQASNIVEALVNLTYLICEEAEHPGKVRQYASFSEERLTAMTQLLRTKWREDL